MEGEVIRLLFQRRKRYGFSRSALKSQCFVVRVPVVYLMNRMPSRDSVPVTDAIDSITSKAWLEKTTPVANNDGDSPNSLMLRHACCAVNFLQRRDLATLHRFVTGDKKGKDAPIRELDLIHAIRNHLRGTPYTDYGILLRPEGD